MWRILGSESCQRLVSIQIRAKDIHSSLMDEHYLQSSMNIIITFSSKTIWNPQVPIKVTCFCMGNIMGKGFGFGSSIEKRMKPS